MQEKDFGNKNVQPSAQPEQTAAQSAAQPEQTVAQSAAQTEQTTAQTVAQPAAQAPAQGAKSRYFLMCERDWIYFTLIAVAGYFGAFTYLLRGNVFCNAQSGNVVLMGLALGQGDWMKALYYLIPISAYLLGAFVSEFLPNPVKRKMRVRWDTLLIAVEMAVVIALGFVPESAPVQISQVAVNFIMSMQYNTFRQAQGEPVATTFVTNHVRQVGVGIAKAIKHIGKDGDKSYLRKFRVHLFMLLFFVAGAVVGTLFCKLILGRAIWVTLAPLAVVFGALLYADLATEKDMKDKKPSVH